jgi:hypothetical protein
MNAKQIGEELAACLRAHRKDYPEAANALNSIALVMSEVLGESAGYPVAQEFGNAPGPVPEDVTEALAKAEAAGDGSLSPDEELDVLNDLRDLLCRVYTPDFYLAEPA